MGCIHMAHFQSSAHSKHFYTTCQYSPIHTHIHTLMAEAAMQGANLLIRSDTAIPIQSTRQCFYAHSHTFTHTQPLGVIWSSLSSPRTHWHVAHTLPSNTHNSIILDRQFRQFFLIIVQKEKKQVENVTNLSTGPPVVIFPPILCKSCSYLDSIKIKTNLIGASQIVFLDIKKSLLLYCFRYVC